MPDRRAIQSRLDTLYPASESDRRSSDSWSGADTRRRRYAILEAFADLTIYSNREHAEAIRRDFRAYKKIRAVAAPFATIVDFHAEHLLGPGPLDPDAGPGDPVPSCLPIQPGADVTDKDAIHRAVAAVWAASNWAVRKERLAWYGAALGDVGLEVVPDLERRKVRLDVVHPGDLRDWEADPYGHIKYASFEYEVIDPADPQKLRYCTYRRDVTNEGGRVAVQTWRDGKPYAWPDTPGSAWDLPWGFVPLVLVHHKDRGKKGGVSELANMLGRGIELDGQESALNDQTLKAIIMPLFMTMAGVPRDRDGKPAKIEFRTAGTGASDDHLILYSSAEGADIEPMVYPVPIGDANERCKRLELIIARDYPELLASDPVGLAASGEARREARKKAEAKVNARRAAYDGGLVRAQQMAMTIGGTLGFSGFEGFDLKSFLAGQTDHRIGPREVFGEDEVEVLGRRQAEATALKTFVDAMLPVPWAARRVGIPQADVDRLAELLALEDQRDRERQRDVPPEDEEQDVEDGEFPELGVVA